MNYPQERIKVHQLLTVYCAKSPVWESIANKDKIVKDLDYEILKLAMEKARLENTGMFWSNTMFCDIYSIIINRVITSSVGSALFDRYLLGLIEASIIARASIYDFNPSINKELRDQIEKRINQRSSIKYSTKYHCNKCKKNETTITEYQARCADEGSSLSIKCINCNYVWRK